MSPSSDAFDLSLAELADRLSRPSAGSGGPGVGTACAAQAALGAALVSMALRSAHRDKEVPESVYPLARAEELDRLRDRLRELATEDERAFATWYAGLDAAPTDERGRKRLEQAREASVEVPLQIMEACLAALRLARPDAERLQEAQRCDLDVGSTLLLAALAGAERLVRANVTLLGGDRPAERLELAASVRRAAQALREALEGSVPA